MMQLLEKTLKKRLETGKLRSLAKTFNVTTPSIDFSSNDYLGLARNLELYKNSHETYTNILSRKVIQTNESQYPRPNHSKWNTEPILGSSGSRLLTGDNIHYHELEQFLAKFHQHKYALLSNSGWDLNFGLCASLPSQDTVVLYDEFCHNSIIAGIRYGRQKLSCSFNHNNIQHLKELLQQIPSEKKERIIFVESVYSMDGDICPLNELLDLAQQFDAHVVVDEAHSTGVFGPHGEGLITSLQLQSHPQLLGTVHTFGKAVGVHGAALLTNYESLLSYMFNYNYPLIYSTSLPLHTLISIRQAYEMMSKCQQERNSLITFIQHYKNECQKYNISNMITSDTPIQGIIVPGNDNVVILSKQLQKKGLNVFPIRAPTVSPGKERLRIVLHAHNTKEEITTLCQNISTSLQELL